MMSRRGWPSPFCEGERIRLLSRPATHSIERHEEAAARVEAHENAQTNVRVHRVLVFTVVRIHHNACEFDELTVQWKI